MDASEYAKHRGVSKSMVSKYLQAGMIPSARKVGRGYDIDPEQADRDLAANLNQAQQRHTPAPAAVVRQEPRQDGPRVPSLAENRNIREYYSARIAKLDYEQRASKLVSKDELKLKLAKLHLAVRDNLRTIPDRIAPVLAAETDQAKVHAMLLKEIGQALEGLKGFDWR